MNQFMSGLILIQNCTLFFSYLPRNAYHTDKITYPNKIKLVKKASRKQPHRNQRVQTLVKVREQTKSRP